MKKFRWIIILFVFILVCSFAKDKNRKNNFDVQRIYTVAELQEDFRCLRRDIEKRQPNLYLYSTKERVDFVFDSLYKGIDRPMNFGQFFYHITPLVSAIKDGHNLIGLSEARGKFNDKNALYLPLHISYIGGKLYSDMNCSTDTAIYDGAEITGIDGKTVEQIRAEFSVRMVRDGYNQSLPDWIMNTFFRGYYSILNNHPANYTIQYAGRDGVQRTSVVPGEPIDTIVNMKIRKYKSRMEFQNKRQGMQLSFDTLSKTAVLSITSFDPDILKKIYHQHFKKLVRRFFRQIDSAQSENLVIDIRNNNGGDPAFSLYLLKQIMNEPFVYAEAAVKTRRFNPGDKFNRLTKCRVPGFGVGKFNPDKNAFRGKVFVLINGGSFSASGEFASVLERYKRAVFIGEEAGGNNVICGGQSFKHKVVLPNTGIVCYTGTEATIIRDLKTNTGHGTMPDFFVSNSLEDILTNRDAVMEFALKKVRE